MITIDDYRKYVEKVMDKGLPDDLNNEGRTLLEEDFKQEVIELFKDYIYIEMQKAIEENDKMNFIYIIGWNGIERFKNFINKNWNRLDEIMQILQDYIIYKRNNKKNED